jgi:hypothetical protein
MRCGRAERWLAAAGDGELSARRRAALDRHLAACASCRAEQAATARVLEAIAALPGEAAVPDRLEQATLRAVRLAAAAEDEARQMRPWRRWLAISMPALAAAAVVVLAVVGMEGDPAPASRPAEVARRPAPRVEPPAAVARDGGAARRPVTRETAPPVEVARRPADDAPPAAPDAPAAAPVELVSMPDLFVELPMLQHLEKLKNFDSIITTTVDGDLQAPGEESQSSG